MSENNDRKSPLEILLDSEAYQARRRDAMLTMMARHGDLARTIAEELRLADINVLTFSPDVYTYDITFEGNRDDYVKFCRVMGKHGLRPATHLPETKVTSWSTHWYMNDDDSSCFWSFFTSNKCRRVQTGSKMTEVPVYEIQCDE